jgi:hypothetical protein
MPTSDLMAGVTGRQTLSTSFQTPHTFRSPVPLISTNSFEALGPELVGFNGANFGNANTYPAASRVLAYQFEIAEPFLIRKVFWYNGGTATTDSADVGVYNEAGTVLIVSAGSTAISGANQIQEKDCTDTLLQAGRYWCAYVQGGTTATPYSTTMGVLDLRCSGCAQMAGSGSTLGATFTPAAIASAYMPSFGIANRTLAA